MEKSLHSWFFILYIHRSFNRQWKFVFYPTRVVSEKALATHSSTLARKLPRRRSLVGYSPWGHEESDTTERLPFHFSLSCIGEGNGNPLQSSCLENPRNGGARWAALYGVTQSQTQLTWLSSSSSRVVLYTLPIVIASTLACTACSQHNSQTDFVLEKWQQNNSTSYRLWWL